MMWKFLRGGATVIPGATFIPESSITEGEKEENNLARIFLDPIQNSIENSVTGGSVTAGDYCTKAIMIQNNKTLF